MFLYIIKLYAFLIKVSVTTKQLIRRNSVCSLKNLAIFFHRVSIEIGLTLPLPVCFHSLFKETTPPHPNPPRKPLHNKSFIKNGLLEEMEGVNDNASAFMHLNVKANK